MTGSRLAMAECDALAAALPDLGARAGRRDLLGTEAGRRLAGHDLVRALADDVLGPGARPLRLILFDKSPASNWRVPWHQDLSVALAERREVPGFGPWRVRDGVLQALAPPFVLERMLALRVHLDDCDEDGGALRVLPGTHRLGRLDSAGVARAVAAGVPRALPVPRGGIVAMRPLLLHASSPSRRSARRRVLHLELGSGELPGGLRWR